MSDPGELPCRRVMDRLWEYLDGELEGAGAERIREHLDLCARCLPEYDFREAYLRYMRRCAGQRVPPGLRRRVFEAILEEERRASETPPHRISGDARENA